MELSWEHGVSDVVIVSGRRRTWPEEVKRRLLAEALAPGESICGVARRHELDPAQLYQWRRKFRETDARGCLAVPVAGFLPVDIGAAAPAMPLGLPPEQVDSRPMARPKVDRQERPRMEIVLVNGRRLLLPLTVSPALVKELAEVLEGA